LLTVITVLRVRQGSDQEREREKAYTGHGDGGDGGEPSGGMVGSARLVVGVGSRESLPAEVGERGESGGAGLCWQERKHAPYKSRFFFLSIQQDRSFTGGEEACGGGGGGEEGPGGLGRCLEELGAHLCLVRPIKGWVCEGWLGLPRKKKMGIPLALLSSVLARSLVSLSPWSIPQPADETASSGIASAHLASQIVGDCTCSFPSCN
jgi:hypothetical protein